MEKTKRGKKDHESLIFKDLKKILKDIFEIKKIDKHTIPRNDITYDMFVSIGSIRKGLKGYDFFDFLFQKKILIAELKTPGEYFGLAILAQMEDIKGSYLSFLKREKKLTEEELEKTVIITIVSCISDGFIKRRLKRGMVIEAIEGKKGLYLIRGSIDSYIMVIDKLGFNVAYVDLLKYMTNVKRLLSLIPKMKEGLKKEKYKKILADIFDYRPELFLNKEVKEMIPVFSAEKDRIEYIKRVFKGVGKEDVIKQLSAKDIISHLKPKDIIKQLTPKDVLKFFNKKDTEVLKKEGRTEGENNKAIEVAKNLKKSGVSIEIIAKSTGLSQTEIKKL